MEASEQLSPITKKSLILRLVIIVVVTFAIAEATEYISSRFHSPESALLELVEHIAELSLLFVFIYRFVTRPMFAEISRRIKTEEQLRKSEAANLAILDALPDTILRISSDGVILDFRLESEGLPDVSIGCQISRIFPESSMKEIMVCLDAALAEGRPQKLDIMQVRDGEELHQELRIVKSGTGEVLIIISNITERKQYEQKLTYISTHDPLTGLFNRTFYEAELDRLGRGRQFPVSIIVIDLDGLKDTNDSRGHAAGDELIRKAAEVLRMAFRADDLVARTGGDEFTILITETDQHALELVVDRINVCLAESNRVDPGLPLRLSMGTAIAESREGFSEAVRLADLRMYEDKALRKSAAA